MSRLNQPIPRGVQTTPTRSHEGGDAVLFDDPLRELALTAVSTYIGEDTFYERADARLDRLIGLTADATKRNPRGTADLIRKLRSEYKIRTASIVMAVTYALAGGLRPRAVVASALQRPDEPAEFVAHWIARTGRRTLPGGIQRGVGDAVSRMYTPAGYLKYKGAAARGVSMADVIELVHPPASGTEQAALYKYILDEAHHKDGKAESVEMLRLRKELMSLDNDLRRAYLRSNPGIFPRAGMTWEALSGWLPGGMDAEAWGFAIPHMGVMALLRNLRNFDDAEVPPRVRQLVINAICDEEKVLRSRVFPYQVWSAYREVHSDHWLVPLGQTFEHACGSLPDLSRSLVLVDASASMRSTLSQRGTICRMEVAALMGVALGRQEGSTVAIFGDTSEEVRIPKGASTLRLVAKVQSMIRSVGSSTYGHTAIRARFRPGQHKRVVMFTDDQMWDNPHLSSHVPTIISVNLAGERSVSSAGKGRYNIGGFSDATFAAMADLVK